LDLSSAAVRLKPVADAAVETVSHFLKYALVRDTERRSPPLSTVGGTRIEFSRGDVDGFRRSACTIVPSSWHQRIITLVTKITPINITTETSLTSLLDEAAKRPLLLERDGELFRLEREDDIADEPDAEFVRPSLPRNRSAPPRSVLSMKTGIAWMESPTRLSSRQCRNR
jgi:hypothetical protein